MRKFLLTLVALLSVTLGFAQTELLKNGGFETWNGDVPAEWHSQKAYSNATVTASTEARGGSKAVQMVNGSAGTSKEGNQRIASDVMALKAGTYTFSIYSKAVEGQAAARLGYVPVTKQDDGSYKAGNYSWGYNQNKVNGPDTISTEWFKQSYTFTLKETTVLSLCVMHSKNFISASILLDDASLTTTDGGISTEETGGNTDTPSTPVVVEAEHISIAEFLKKADTNTTYELTGTVTSISNATYGNLYIEEDGASVFVYGVLDEKGQKKNFASLNIAVGDLLTIQGKYKVYNDAAEIENAQFIKVVKGEVYECEGDGTELNPYTAEDVKHLVGTVDAKTKFWVSGMILGCCKSGTELATEAAASNLAIGDADCWVPVQLPDNDVRKALNLVDNPENLGKEVMVYGTLEAYFSVAGVKNVTEYRIAGGGDIEIVAADATALTGTYTIYNHKLVELMPGYVLPTYEVSTITVTGNEQGDVTITGLAAEPITGVFVEMEDVSAVLFEEDPYIIDAEDDEVPAYAAYSNGLLYFVNGIAGVTQNATAILEGATLEEIGGEKVDLYTMEFNYADAMTGEESTFTCPVYMGVDEDGYVILTNFLGVSCFDAMMEEGGFAIAPAMKEDGSPIMFDMASEDDFALHFVKDGDNYKYECAAPGYCAINMQYYILSINLKKAGAAEEDAIKSIADKMAQNIYYNLQGQKVSNTQKGLVIKNGRVVIK